MVVENALCDVAKVVVRSVASEISAIHEKAQVVLFSSILSTIFIMLPGRPFLWF